MIWILSAPVPGHQHILCKYIKDVYLLKDSLLKPGEHTFIPRRSLNHPYLYIYILCRHTDQTDRIRYRQKDLLYIPTQRNHRMDPINHIWKSLLADP